LNEAANETDSRPCVEDHGRFYEQAICALFISPIVFGAYIIILLADIQDHGSHGSSIQLGLYGLAFIAIFCLVMFNFIGRPRRIVFADSALLKANNKGTVIDSYDDIDFFVIDCQGLLIQISPRSREWHEKKRDLERILPVDMSQLLVRIAFALMKIRFRNDSFHFISYFRKDNIRLNLILLDQTQYEAAVSAILRSGVKCYRPDESGGYILCGEGPTQGVNHADQG